MSHELLFELGTEEIPAAFIPGALEHLKSRLSEQFEKLGLSDVEVLALGTPRRLTVSATGLPLERPRVKRTALGPAKRAAYDAEGNLTKAALGFARSQGVEPSSLFVEETPKGSYIAALKEEGGEALAPLLTAFLPELVRGLPFKKSMRWGDRELRFARPIHWFLAAFAGEPLHFELEGIRSGLTSRGMRFFGPATFEARTRHEYLEGSRRCFMTVDPAERRAQITAELEQHAQALGGSVDLDAHLLDEATYLTECPRVIVGHFEAQFLEMPAHVPVTVMKHHQRYFPVYGAEGQLLPVFLAVINTPTQETERIVAGNERVMRARLSDGQFFWHEDLKAPLDARLDKLAGIIFHAKLGTSKAKVERVVRLAGWLATQVGGEALRASAERAALLSKADLVTRMVSEFPELQGIMGGIYARRFGEPEAIAQAIEQHYQPTQAGGALPASLLGAVVSVADKLDSLVGFMGVGLSPSSAADPFGLRRQALGVLSILAERGWNLPLSTLVQAALEGLAGVVKRPASEVVPEVLEFLKTRLRGQLLNEGAPTDMVNAVISADASRVPDVKQRLHALRNLSRSGDFAALMIAFKRASNITKEQQDAGPEALVALQPVEETLWQAAEQVQAAFASDVQAGQYERALGRLLALKAPIDTFFDTVLVMDPDLVARTRRLALLFRITALFRGIADLSRISTEG